MAARKPSGRSGGGATRQQQQRPAARTGSGRNGQTRANSSGNAAAGAKSRTSASRPGADRGRSASAVRPVASNGTKRAATATRATSQPVVAPPAAGPFGRLLAPLRSMGWLPLATFVLSLYGLGASIYLTLAHYDTSIHLACADNGLVNCEAVTTSPESIVFGIFPVAVLGLAFYVFMVVINSPWGWRLSKSQPLVHWARLGSVIVGMGFVLYLIYAELIEIKAICLWCTSVHAATFLIFVLVVFHASLTGIGSPAKDRG